MADKVTENCRLRYKFYTRQNAQRAIFCCHQRFGMFLSDMRCVGLTHEKCPLKGNISMANAKTRNDALSALYEGGFITVKKTNSGMDAGLNKRGKFSPYQVATPKWVEKNVPNTSLYKLAAGETVGVSVKRGRGFSYIEVTRYSKEDASKLLNKQPAGTASVPVPDAPALPVIEGKSADMVHKGYIPYPEDWKRQYDMLLMDGVTCGSCAHSERCKALFDGNDANTSCQFYPNRFTDKSEE